MTDIITSIAAEVIPGVRIEANDDGTLILEQDWCGNVDRVAVHKVHIRYIAEKLGMVREVSASDAELLRTERGRVATLSTDNDRLKRSLLRLHQHTLALQRNFVQFADFDHCDLSDQLNDVNNLVALFDLVVDDFVDAYDAHAPKPLEAVPIADSLRTTCGQRKPIAPSAPEQLELA